MQGFVDRWSAASLEADSRQQGCRGRRCGIGSEVARIRRPLHSGRIPRALGQSWTKFMRIPPTKTREDGTWREGYRVWWNDIELRGGAEVQRPRHPSRRGPHRGPHHELYFWSRTPLLYPLPPQLEAGEE